MHLQIPQILTLSTDPVSNPEHLIQIGNQCAQHGEMVAAEGYYRQAIATHPHSAIAHQNLAEALRQQYRFDEANQHYRQAIALHDAPVESASPAQNQENSNMNMMSSSAADPSYLNLALKAIEQKSWERAIILTQQELQQNPQSSEAYRLLGQARQATHQFSQAQRCFQQAIALDANNADALANLGDFYVEQRQLEDAVANYQQAIAHYQARHQLQKRFEQHTQTIPSSAPQLQISLEQTNGKSIAPDVASPASPSTEPKIESEVPTPLNMDTLLQTANDRMVQRQWHEAIALYQRALEVRPDAATYRLLGNALQATQQLDAAAQAYRKAVKLCPNGAEIHANLGTVYAKLQQWDRAIRHYHKAVELKPESAGIYRNLGKIFEQLGESRRATECWYRAFMLEPEGATATDLARIGDRFSEQQAWERAEECYRLALQQDSELLAAYLGLGQGLEQQGKWSEAIAVYRQLLRVHPTVPEVAEKLVQAILKVERAASEKPGAEILAETTPKHETVPNQVDDEEIRLAQAKQVHERGSDAVQRADWHEAVEAFQQAIALNSDFSWSYNDLGYALVKLERWEEAVYALQRAAILNPEFHWTYYNLGEALLHLKRWDEAVNAYQRAYQIESDLPYIHQKLGDAMFGQAKANQEAMAQCYQQAIQDDSQNVENYYKLIELQSDNLTWYLGLGSILNNQGELDKAIAIYQIAIDLQPDHFEPHFELGKVIEKKGCLEEAIALYRQAIKLNYQHCWCHHFLGDALTKLGQFDEAIDCYYRAIDLNPEESPWHYSNLADVFRMKNQLDKAEYYYRKAISINPHFLWSHQHLGDILLKKGNPREAGKFYKNALQLKPQ